MKTKSFTQKLPKGLPPLPKLPKGWKWELKGWGWVGEGKKVPYGCANFGDKIWSTGAPLGAVPQVVTPVGDEDFYYILAVKNTPKKKPAPKVRWHNPEKVPASKVPAGWRFLREGEIPKGKRQFWCGTLGLKGEWSSERGPFEQDWTYIVPDESAKQALVKKAPEPILVATGIEAMVCADIAARQAIGKPKYGTTVAENPLSLVDWFTHLYEEQLDSAIYTRKIIEIFKQLPGKVDAMAREIGRLGVQYKTGDIGAAEYGALTQAAVDGFVGQILENKNLAGKDSPR